MNNFLSQFNNDSRFEIYIHLDGKTKEDIDNGKKIIKSNIKYCEHLFNSPRFSIEMVEVMYELLSKANKNYKYDYYHFFSESCYLIKSLDEFYNFFQENNLNSFVPHFFDKNFLYKNKTHKLYKGTQWMSLHKSIVYKLLNNKHLFTKYKKEVKNNKIKLIQGALDECILQNMIVLNIYNKNSQKYKIKNKDIRYIRWNNCSNEYCPNFLNIDNVSENETNYIRKNFLIIRKINYKDFKSIELINKLRGFS